MHINMHCGANKRTNERTIQCIGIHVKIVHCSSLVASRMSLIVHILAIVGNGIEQQQQMCRCTGNIINWTNYSEIIECRGILRKCCVSVNREKWFHYAHIKYKGWIGASLWVATFFGKRSHTHSFCLQYVKPFTMAFMLHVFHMCVCTHVHDVIVIRTPFIFPLFFFVYN